MDFQGLDQMFKSVLDRLETGKGMSLPSGSMLAGDHFLLKKGWEYFKERIRQIEDQYETLLAEKSRSIASLEKENQALREQSMELERKYKSLELFQNEMSRSRTEDHYNFKKTSENIRNIFESERVQLESRISELELKIEKERENAEILRSNRRTAENKLREGLDILKNENLELNQQLTVLVGDYESQLGKKEEHIESLEKKADILRSEVHRRDDTIRDFQSENKIKQDQVDALINKVENLNSIIQKQRLGLGHLKHQLDVVQNEKKEIRDAWRREQASWRELWDRARTSWEKGEK